MKVSRWGYVRGFALVAVAGSMLLFGCRREIPSAFDRNKPPETIITGAPAESLQAYYQVHLYWTGMDEDGLIDHFEYSITEDDKEPGEDEVGFSGYFRIDKTDSVFLLSSDEPQISQVLNRRFYVRAVDNEGKTDPTPAWTFFRGKDFHYPEVIFLRAWGTWTDNNGQERFTNVGSPGGQAGAYFPRDTVGVGACFGASWTGFDADIDSLLGFQYLVQGDRLSSEYLGGSLADTTTFSCINPEFSGNQTIRVRAIDDAGVVTDLDSVRVVRVNFDPITWVVDPNSEEGEDPIHRKVFEVRGSNDVFPSGTWIADGPRAINLYYTGFDDERDQWIFQDVKNIRRFRYQRVQNNSSIVQNQIPVFEPYPAINTLADANTVGLVSSDWTFVMYAEDWAGAIPIRGNRDTVIVRVNFPPYFTDISHEGIPFLESPASTEGAFNLTLPHPSTGDTTFVLTLAARDTHELGTRHPGRPEIEIMETENGRIGTYQIILNQGVYGEDGQGEDPVSFVLPVADDPFQAGAIHAGLNSFRITVADQPVSSTGKPRKARFDLDLFVTFEGLNSVSKAQ